MHADSQHRLITTEQMYEADRLTIKSGISEPELIAKAAARVCAAVVARYEKCPVLVLAGPGNNGADGRGAAELLAGLGWKVRVGSYGESKPALDLGGFGLIIDALFGAGLSRPLGKDLQALVKRINQSETPVISVDIPTGIDGDTGSACTRGRLGTPIAITADLTVTFFRKKPSHVLYPGRAHCGEIICRDIGIKAGVLGQMDGPEYFENAPDLWRDDFPKRQTTGHKYTNGHVLCVSGLMGSTGAIRLAAMGALRIGAGLVTVAAPGAVMMTHAAHLTEIMLIKADNGAMLGEIAEDKRKNVILIGPGLGLDGNARGKVLAALASNGMLVLDADALTIFADDPQELFAKIKARTAPVILTPHGGEFARLFAVGLGSKLEAAAVAAEQSGAFVVYKGADTVIAAPNGPAFVNTNGSVHLASAGSGDVLAGIIAGLMAQNMPPLAAACAAVWYHGAAGTNLGPGLIASDIPVALPNLLKQIFYSD